MTEPEPQILSVTLAGWPGLERGEVTLDFGSERTVLVGKNGAGKSVVMEAFCEAARVASSRRHRTIETSVKFSCRIGVPGRVDAIYEYQSLPAGASSATREEAVSGTEAVRVTWEEECRTASGDLVWSVKDNELSIGDRKTALPGGIGLLGMFHAIDDLPDLASLIRQRLVSVQLVRAGVPRIHSVTRQFLFMKREEDGRWHLTSPTKSGRIERLALRIAQLHRPGTAEEFAELRLLVARLGLGKDLKVEEAKVKENVFGWVALDGVNLGQLSDGTLRVLEILTYVLAPTRGVVCIEEPETGIHPGLLERLLATIRAYSADRQIVISTHSPYVLRWCDPTELRLVERGPETTIVRRLAVDELDRVEAYLRDEGTLDSFIFEHSEE